MKCPSCEVTLLMSDKNGIEIDYCPNCRGIWLDRGELDKIIERSAEHTSGKGSVGGYERNEQSDRGNYERDYDRRSPEYPSKPYRKKKDSFLGDLFDF